MLSRCRRRAHPRARTHTHPSSRVRSFAFFVANGFDVVICSVRNEMNANANYFVHIFHAHTFDKINKWPIQPCIYDASEHAVCDGLSACVAAFVKNHQETSCFICSMLATRCFPAVAAAAAAVVVRSAGKRNRCDENQSSRAMRNFQCERFTRGICTKYMCLMAIRSLSLSALARTHTFYYRMKRTSNDQ